MMTKNSCPMMEIISPGLLSTVQDLGINGYKWLGVAEGGAMDSLSFVAANRLIGNPDNAAALELTHTGPTIKFLEDIWVSITGADLGAVLNGIHKEPGSAFNVRKGETIKFSTSQYGVRAYLAVAGGIDVPQIMNSRCTYVYGGFGGLYGRPLKKGDQLSAFVNEDWAPSTARVLPEEFKVQIKPASKLRVILGPHDNRFANEGIETFLNSYYEVTHDANRMGYRLKGPKIKHADSPIVVSTATALGTIQVPGKGIPVILLRERGTSGGYTQIACVIRANLDLLAQSFAGDRFQFSKISLEEAQQLEIQRWRALDSWQSPKTIEKK